MIVKLINTTFPALKNKYLTKFITCPIGPLKSNSTKSTSILIIDTPHGLQLTKLLPQVRKQFKNSLISRTIKL